MTYMKEYYDKITTALDFILEKEEKEIGKAAKQMAEAVSNGHSIYLFGASHAGIITEDAFYRAGGFALFNPIFSPSLMLNVEPVTLTSQLERLEGYGSILLDAKPVKAGDVLFIHSVSGRNPVAIDMALEAKERGVTIISLTNVTYSQQVSSRHSSGKRLFEVSDIVIDNGGEPGDAVVSIHSLSQKVAPISTIVGSFTIHSIVLKMIEMFEQEGKDIPIFRSANLDGGDDYNAQLFERYKEQIHYM
ncbi:SIS domain-containing protein [Gracilibacillus alcaliphilus]|uniref:SIS domain-containing protein n=1 Tax=Gracilibacillus alcaliphilus TaxID=1401441 RepID=UPI00195F12CE|nr:SIS domain-containing protein [Gracilibacillus alcaliphilus]MBM7677521.1 putative phosphosugar-binding protein [Gracilibacillus alcaliphilus]